MLYGADRAWFVAPPAQVEGRLLREFLADSETRPTRILTPTARILVRRPPVKPIQLQGDVTDET